MNQDVKALPVVAWVDDLTKPQPHCVTDLRYRSAADADAGKAYTPVVRQSDAESALAELREEVERLRKENRDLMRSRLQESQIADPVHSDRALRLADDAAESVICTVGRSPRERQWVLYQEQIAADPYLDDCIAHLEWRGLADVERASDGVTVIFKTR